MKHVGVTPTSSTSFNRGAKSSGRKEWGGDSGWDADSELLHQNSLTDCSNTDDDLSLIDSKYLYYIYIHYPPANHIKVKRTSRL